MPGDVLWVIHCRDCGHNRAAAGEWLAQLALRIGLAPDAAVSEIVGTLKRRLKCMTCGSRDLDLSERGRLTALEAERRGGDVDEVMAELLNERKAGHWTPDPPTARGRCRACGGFAVDGDTLCLKCAGN